MCPSRGNYPPSSSSSGYSGYHNAPYRNSGRRRDYSQDSRTYDDYRDESSSRRRRDSPTYDEYYDRGPRRSYDDPYTDRRSDYRSQGDASPSRNYYSYRRDERSRSPPRRPSMSLGGPDPSFDTLSRRSPLPTPPRRTEPTEEYNEISSQLPHTTSNPISNPKLLVLDLNGTLVLRGERRRSNYQFSHPRAYTNSGAPPRPLRTVYPRPYLGTFKDFIFHRDTKKWLDTMVWSSAQPHSVNDMVEKCFQDRKDELKDVWARDTLGLTPAEYNQKTQTTKDLDKIWKEVAFSAPSTGPESSSRSTTPSPSDDITPSYPHETRRHSAKSTLLMDDSPLKAILQPWNHLCIPEYDAEMRKKDVAAKTSEPMDVDEAKLEETHAQLEAMTEIVKAGPVVEDGVTEKEAKRKLKKQKKKPEKLEKKAERAALERAKDRSVMPQYDETLLAVIGILDTIKLEENVAAWMKQGGLVDSAAAAGYLDEVAPSSSHSGDSDVEQNDRRASVGSVASSSSSLSVSGKPTTDTPSKDKDKDENTLRDQSPSAHEFPPPSQPDSEMGAPISSSSPPSTSLVEEQDAQISTGVPLARPSDPDASLPAPLWFQDSRILAFWAERGRRACRELGVQVRAEVSDHTS